MYLNQSIKKHLLNQEQLPSKVLKWEQRVIEKYGSQSLKHQPIFIIGAPRTGSTILFQTLSNKYDVLYPDNLVSEFYQNIFLGFWISNKLFKNQAHNNFKSHYGDTEEFGMHSPSEFWQYWYRWLPRTHHYITQEELTNYDVELMKKEITASINYFDKPILFGNNNNGLRINLLKEIFPDAKYIFTYREPLSVTSSLLKARLELKGSYENWWSLMPKNHLILKQLPFIQQVVQQYFYLNKDMLDDLTQHISKKNWFFVDYEYFCKNTQNVCQHIMQNIIQREDAQESDIKHTLSRIKDDKILDALKKEINELPFDDYKI